MGYYCVGGHLDILFSVLTRSRRRFPKCTSSCDESTVITDICTAGNCSSDSGADRSIVRTLRYSESSDKVNFDSNLQLLTTG
jgi:hypothetical protein